MGRGRAPLVLHQEIVAKGYGGHYQRVKLAVQPLRRGLSLEEVHERTPSPREVARWIASSPDLRTLETGQRLSRLLDHCPELRRVDGLVREFARMLDTQDAGLLPGWLDRLTTAGLPPLGATAKAIREDKPAVVQGITTPFSSGMNEGRITDVKLQKRIMGRRAGVPLLRQRVVLIAHLRRHYPDPSPP